MLLCRPWPLTCCASHVLSFLNLRALELMVPSVSRHSFSYLHDLFLHIIQASAYTELLQRGFCWPFSPEWFPIYTPPLHSSSIYYTSPLCRLFLVNSVLFVPLGIEARALGMLSQQWPLSHITALEFATDSCFLHSLSRFHQNVILRTERNSYLGALIASEVSRKPGTQKPSKGVCWA